MKIRKRNTLVCSVIAVTLLVGASPLVLRPARALASNVYEMGASLQYCPFTLCGDYEYFYGTSGTINISGDTLPLTDTYNWAISLDNNDNGLHTWFQAGLIVGLAPDGKFYSSPTFYVEYQTPSSYTFQTYSSVPWNTDHSIKIFAGGAIITGTNDVQAWLDGSLIYHASDCCAGQGWVPSAFLEIHQAGTGYAIFTNGGWSNLAWWGGGGIIGAQYCGPKPYGSLFCNLMPTNSNPFEIPNPPGRYTLIMLSQSSFQAGLWGGQRCPRESDNNGR